MWVDLMCVWCPDCGATLDRDLFDDEGFAICPYCEREIEIEVNEDEK